MFRRVFLSKRNAAATGLHSPGPASTISPTNRDPPHGANEDPKRLVPSAPGCDQKSPLPPSQIAGRRKPDCFAEQRTHVWSVASRTEIGPPVASLFGQLRTSTLPKSAPSQPHLFNSETTTHQRLKITSHLQSVFRPTVHESPYQQHIPLSESGENPFLLLFRHPFSFHLP
jgi:hypothetical protein